jgi:hypothetical protein
VANKVRGIIYAKNAEVSKVNYLSKAKSYNFREFLLPICAVTVIKKADGSRYLA